MNRLTEFLPLLWLLTFVCIAGDGIMSPGLYCDEMLFVNAAPGENTFPEARRHFLDIAAPRDWKTQIIKVVHDPERHGVFEINEILDKQEQGAR